MHRTSPNIENEMGFYPMNESFSSPIFYTIISMNFIIALIKTHIETQTDIFSFFFLSVLCRKTNYGPSNAIWSSVFIRAWYCEVAIYLVYTNKLICALRWVLGVIGFQKVADLQTTFPLHFWELTYPNHTIHQCPSFDAHFVDLMILLRNMVIRQQCKRIERRRRSRNVSNCELSTLLTRLVYTIFCCAISNNDFILYCPFNSSISAVFQPNQQKIKNSIQFLRSIYNWYTPYYSVQYIAYIW